MASQPESSTRPSPTTYDVHTHVGLDTAFYLSGWWPYAATVQELLEHMDASGIARAATFPFCVSSAYDVEQFRRDRSIRVLPGRFPYDRENELLITECERVDRDRRLLPFPMFDPAREVAAQVKSLQKLAAKAAGLKTQTTIGQAPIRKLLDESRDLMLLAQEHDLPVVFHTTVLPADPWAQVRDCLDVAEAYPKVRFNLAHSLRFDLPMLRRAAELPNVWIDCAAHLAHCGLARADHPAVAPKDRRVDADYTRPGDVFAAVHAIIGAKYMWGSDNPFQSWCDDGIREVHSYADEVAALRSAPAQVQHDMLCVGPAAWLGARATARP